MSRATRTKAIVLRRTNYGEADRVVQLITPQGRRAAMARGVRKEKSRLAGGIELFAVCDVVLAGGRGKLDVMTSARLVQFYRHILDDYDRMEFGYEVLKQVARASEMVDEPEWYSVAAEVLTALDTVSVDLQLIKAWFYVQYGALLGHELPLWRDVSGEALLPGTRYRYDVGEQGLRQATDGQITAEHIKLLRLMSAKPLGTLAQVGGIGEVVAECFLLARTHAGV